MFDELKAAYYSGKRLAVVFTKANGDERLMVVQRSLTMESAVKGGRAKNSDALHVCEITKDGTVQWRSIPPARLKSWKVLG